MGNHKWERFSNPRNSRVTLNACLQCGALQGTSSPSVCKQVAEEKHSLLKMGWVIVGQKAPIDVAYRLAS